MGYVEDRWENFVDGHRVRTARYGKGSRWRARYVDPEGHLRAKGFARRIDAERFLATVTTDVLRGAYVDPSAGRIRFEEFAAAWLDARTCGDSTREAMETRFRRHVFPYLGQSELSEIRPSVLQSWLRGLQQSLAPTYVRIVLANVSSVFSAAVDDGLLARNPCSAQSVRPPRSETRKVEPWPVEQVKAVIDALPPRYRALATVAAGCGLRQGEAFGLRVVDIDFLRHRVRVEQQVKIVGGRIRIEPPKGGKRRVVPLPDTIALELAEHLRQFPADGTVLAFTSREHQALNRNYFNSHVWKPALVRAGVEPSRQNGMHALRHFYASVLIDAGESVKAVAEYLGHADAGFTLRVYAHLFPSSEHRARSAVDRALTGSDPAAVVSQTQGVES
jgi:integrase